MGSLHLAYVKERNMEKIFIFLGVLFLGSFNLRSEGKIENSTSSDRHKKILNLFTVVRFPNNGCTGNNGFNGTCYTSEECENRGGSSGGSCGGGYGICCTFTVGCGETSSENCTYFQSSGQEVGACRLKICPCSENICQLRLDFGVFVINGPSTETTSVTKCGGLPLFELGQCQTDMFSVTAPGNNAPPVICGINSNEHMYVDSSSQCNDLAFNIGAGTSTVTRSWTIKITQYSCDYDNLAPDGCTQYFFGTARDVVKTYNFDGGQHLASQDQNICVRRERGTCRICWSTTAEGDFELTTGMVGSTGTAKLPSKGCCGYGTDCANTATGFDCAIIPSPSNTKGTELATAFEGICGGELSTEDASADAKTVCSMSVPFNIRFLSDLYETDAEDEVLQNGFRLSYTLRSC